jgi:hypothetical protein
MIYRRASTSLEASSASHACFVVSVTALDLTCDLLPNYRSAENKICEVKKSTPALGSAPRRCPPPLLIVPSGHRCATRYHRTRT